ncbi:hypothetical protein quinque_003620 [Culex quinquefasciatus]
MSAVLHQLTRTEVGEDTCSNLRCLIADEIVHLEPAVLTSLGIPSDNESLQTFIFRLKTGLQNGGVASLVLLSSLLGVTIYLYRYNQDTLRMNPADQAGSAAVHIYEHIADDSSTFSSVLRIVPDQPSLPQVPETTSDGKNPIIIADNISRTEFAGTPQSVHSSMTIPSHQGLRLGSLNVNGCRVSAKRDKIDALLVSHKVHVAVLQEEDSGPDLIPNLQPESACPPLPDPPTIDEVRAILERIKNGKTPGVDNLYAEYLKYGGTGCCTTYMSF